MAVTYTNNWYNILSKLTNTIKSEFGIPVIIGNDEMKSKNYIRVIPEGSSMVELASFSEQREFNANIQYVTQRRRENDDFIENLTVQTSKLEALIHENQLLTLSDSTIAFNCHFSSQEFDFEIDGMEDSYIINWTWQCNYISNIS
jgi:hypothetical protein